MKKRQTRKLALARETLLRLEEQTLSAAGAGRPTNESICFCLTDLCISVGYTGCSECNCA